MTRTAPTAVFLLLLALPALAHAETLSGTVRVSGRKVEVVDGDVAVRITGDLEDTIKAFVGRSVELTGAKRFRTFRVDRIVSPVRDEKTLTARNEGGSWTLHGREGTFAAFGRVKLLTSGREVTVDLWIFPAKPDALQAACVEAVEALTVGDWTFLTRKFYGYTIITGFVRGQNRSLWVVDKKDGQLYVRRGDDAGWVSQDKLRVGQEPRAGMTRRLGG